MFVELANILNSVENEFNVKIENIYGLAKSDSGKTSSRILIPTKSRLIHGNISRLFVGYHCDLRTLTILYQSANRHGYLYRS